MSSPVILDWYAADLRTGIVLEELHSLTAAGALSRRLGSSTSLQADLALDGAPPAWEEATTPGRTLLVAVDRVTQAPVWPGLLLTREGGSAPTAELGMASPEAYLDRRYTGSYTDVGQDQAVIMTGLGTALTVDAPPFTFDTQPTGTAADYSVLDGDDRTILSVWQELMGLEGGPEWTVDVAWADAAHTRFVLPIRIRHQLGIQSVVPEPVFDFPGNTTAYSVTESYESGKGGNQVLAWGDGEGAGRLHSGVHTAQDLLDAGWPRWVHRFTPASGLTDPAALDRHAAQALAQMRTGATAWTLNATASRAPRLGTDWGLGDAIRIQVTHSPRHPSGIDVVARAYGWDLDPAADTVTPVLLQED